MRDDNMDAALDAILEGKIALAKILLSQRIHVDLLDGDCTPLYRVMSAFHCRQLDIVEFLLESGAEPNHPQHGGSLTVLFLAAGHGMFGALELLLKHGGNPNLLIDGGTCLHISTTNPRVEMLQLLLDYGADFSIKDDEGKSPIDTLQESWDYRRQTMPGFSGFENEALIREMISR